MRSLTEKGGELKKTPLHPVHREAGARMVPFGGWEMPVQYTSVLTEHRAVRSSAGLFDLSHMGEFYFSGPHAQANLQRLLTNDVSRLQPGRAQYTLICNEQGGIVDDVLLYRLEEERYLLVVNAANTEKDYQWLRERLDGRTVMADESDETALLALQGPRSQEVLAPLVSADLTQLRSFSCVETEVLGIEALVSRTGYTGEDGFEIYFDRSHAKALWDGLLEAGENAGVVPVGLGARDTLRLEACLPLYGNDLSEETTPFEAGLGFAVKLDKGTFIGRDALQKQQEEGPEKRLVAFEMTERGVPRQGYAILKDGEAVGQVTSGSFSPSLERDIGMGYVPTELSTPGTEIEIDIRGKGKRGRVIEGRFISRR